MRPLPLLDRIRMAANLEGGHFRHARHRIASLTFGTDEDWKGRQIDARCRCGHAVTTWARFVDGATPAMKHGPRTGRGRRAALARRSA